MKATGFKNLVGSLRRVLATLPDRRVGKNLSYAIEDFGLRAFSVFFTQCPSFLTHQRSMQQAKSLNNATRLFDNLRALTRFFCFGSWEELMQFMMRGLEIGPYAEPP